MTGEKLSLTQIDDFRQEVWGHYRTARRDMPWRTHPTPYYVLVSEMMLQQTQVTRVIPKFEAFVAAFPDVHALSRAPLADVLVLWNGLGYNRRARYLWQAAKQIVDEYGGRVPDDLGQLESLPGIGPNTAGAICAYAFDRPVTFVETNLRTVYLHHFFAEVSSRVTDTQLRELIDRTRDDERPREWYWALMDYGAYLKKTAGGRLTQSHHYRKQAPLRGSLREMRGRIVRVLASGRQNDAALKKLVAADERYRAALSALENEGLIERSGRSWRLTVNPDAR